MEISVTKYIILEISSFSDKMIHDEERYKYSPDNLTNPTDPIISNIDPGNDTFTFKESTSNTDRLDLV